ncbi:branched-chain amino acid ABC transporter permease [Sporolactobacillus sp. THM7-7]|nr:branched-chain amino acid ABC transporter permease [Sporolactobacillus sp. THM7-7]
MDMIGQQLMNAVMLGTMYSLVAIGFSLFFGTMNVIHFSHGDISMLGAFIALFFVPIITQYSVLGSVIMFIGAIVIVAVLGIFLSGLVIQPLQSSPQLYTLLATLEAGLVIREAIRLFYPGGKMSQKFPIIFPSGGFSIGGLTIRFDQLFILAIGVAVFVATVLIVNKTSLGMAIRAYSQDKEASMMMGVSESKVIAVTFALGSALAAIAGILHGTYYREVIYTMGLTSGIIGFSAATIGGLGSIWGAIVGGYLFAFIQTSVSAFVPGGSEYRDVIAFGVMILFLLFRPTGILGERQSERV